MSVLGRARRERAGSQTPLRKHACASVCAFAFCNLCSGFSDRCWSSKPRVVPEGWAQFGDIVNGDGDNNESIWGGTFEDETLVVAFDKRGVVVRMRAPYRMSVCWIVHGHVPRENIGSGKRWTTQQRVPGIHHAGAVQFLEWIEGTRADYSGLASAQPHHPNCLPRRLGSVECWSAKTCSGKSKAQNYNSTSDQ